MLLLVFDTNHIEIYPYAKFVFRQSMLMRDILKLLSSTQCPAYSARNMSKRRMKYYLHELTQSRNMLAILKGDCVI